MKTNKLPIQLSVTDDMMFYDMRERIDSDTSCRIISVTDFSGPFIVMKSAREQIAVAIMVEVNK